MSTSPYIRAVEPRTRYARLPGQSFSLASLADYGLLTLLFATAAGSFYKLGFDRYVWALTYAACAAVVLRDRDRLMARLTARWPLFLFPASCVLSVLVSVDPAASLRNAAQYTVTAVMALWVGTAFTVPAIVRCLSLTLMGCVAVSVAAAYSGLIEGFRQDDYVGAEIYFTGLYTQKNVMGNVIVLASLATLVAGAVSRRALLAYAVVLLAFPVLLMTKSTTALLQYLAALTFVPVLKFMTSVEHKLAVLLALTVAVLAAAFSLIALDVDLVATALEAVGKDATLTGRTVIWNEGLAVFLERPFWGVGYQAFWTSPDLADVVQAIRAALLESIGGFHNGYLEAAVATGIPGLALYVLMIGYALSTNAGLAFEQRTAASLGALYFILHIAFRTFTESALYYQHDLELILLVALTAAAPARVAPATASRRR